MGEVLRFYSEEEIQGAQPGIPKKEDIPGSVPAPQPSPVIPQRKPKPIEPERKPEKEPMPKEKPKEKEPA